MGYWEDRQKQRKPLNTDKINKDVDSFLLKLAWATYREIKLTISEGERTGKVYKRKGKTHTASAPGEPPATDTGKLVNSVGTPKKINDKEYVVPINSLYAMYLELGTINMRPRSFIKQSMERAWEKVKNDK